MITVHLLLFAHYQDVVGQRNLAVALPEGSTVQTLEERLAMTYPALAGVFNYAKAAVNEEFAPVSTQLHDGDEVAIMPPMSGGSLGFC